MSDLEEIYKHDELLLNKKYSHQGSVKESTGNVTPRWEDCEREVFGFEREIN